MGQLLVTSLCVGAHHEVRAVRALLALVSCEPAEDPLSTSSHSGAPLLFDQLPPPTGPLLLHAPYMIRGVDVDLHVSRLGPGDTVGLTAAARRTGPPTYPPLLAPVCLDLPGPIVLLGTASASLKGNASFPVAAPNSLSATTIALQAATLH
jgi:hypothetical protein